MPRRIVASAATLLASAMLVLPSAATAANGAVPTHDHVTASPGTHHFTMSPAMVPVVDGPANNHNATIDTTLYVPDNASTSHPQPAILLTHGFGLAKDSAEVTNSAKFFARHGYIVLAWTSQGFGKSSGCITLDSYDFDVKDVEQLITKRLQPRLDVRRDAHGLVLGMVGGSYGGGITLNLAAVDRRIRAIAAGRTWNNLAYSLDPNNVVLPGEPSAYTHTQADQGVFKQAWTSAFFAQGNAQPFGGLPSDGSSHGKCIQDKLLSGDPVQVAGTPCTGFPIAVCQTFVRVSTTGNASAADRQLLANSSVTTKIGQLRAATLLVQGESDTLFNLDEAVATYTTLKAAGVPVAMTWNYGGHGGYNSQPGECELYDGQDYPNVDNCYLTLRTLTWFEHWLRGAPLGDFPGFTYYRNWSSYAGTGPDDEQYGVAPAFPAMAS